MTISVAEAIGQSTKLSAASGGNADKRKFFVIGTSDRDEALAALLAEITGSQSLGTNSTLIANELVLDEIAPNIWESSVDYVAPEATMSASQPKSVGEVTFAFDGAGGTFQLQEAYAQTKYGPNAPNHGNAINVNDGKVEGVEVVIPNLTLTVSQRFDGASLSFAWLRSLIFATGTVNSDEFIGFDPGEVLFLGPAGQQPLAFLDNGTVARGERDIEFRFAVSPNLTDLTFGTITGVDKAGWDYLWLAHEETEDDTGAALTKKLLGVYVAQVYRRSAFANLGISNPFVSFPVAGS